MGSDDRPVGVERSEDHDFCPSPRPKQQLQNYKDKDKILRYFDILVWIIYGRINDSSMTTSVNNPNQKYFIYARKSTDVEDMQVQSIEGQLDELRILAKKESLNIVEEFIEKQSAKIPGRPIFNKMLDSIEKGLASGIICWHPDRLARNSVDGGKIIYLVDTGKISALKFNTFWFEPTPQGKFMLSMSFSQSKYYVDSLSENTSRGLRQKARNGFCPGPAPIGYLNDSRTKTVVLNKKISPIIKEVFEKYAVGNQRMLDISLFLASKGILQRNKKPYRLGRVKNILTNSYYYGHFRFVGEIYEGRYDPIVSKALFDKVQEVLNSKNKQWSYAKVERISKPFLGLLRCGECGMMITAENKIKRYKNGGFSEYHYYHCTKKNKNIRCSQPYNTTEESIHSQLTTLLKKYALRRDWANQMLLKLKKEESDISQSSLSLISSKRREIDNLNTKLKILLDTYLDQEVDKEIYRQKKYELVSKRKTIEEQIINLQNKKGSWIEPMREWINEAQTVEEVAKSADLQLKKVLAVKIFGSNLFLENKIVRGDGQKSWSSLRSTPTGRGWEAGAGIEPAHRSFADSGVSTSPPGQ